MYCKKCGKEIIDGSRFCYNCGYKLDYDDFGDQCEDELGLDKFSEESDEIKFAQLGRAPIGRLVASGVDEVKEDKKPSAFFNMLRWIIGLCMLSIGIVGLLLLFAPAIYIMLYDASGNIYAQTLLTGFDTLRGKVLTTAFEYACWSYLVVTIFCIIYGLVLLIMAIKRPHSLFRNPATWVIDAVVAIVYIAIYCVAINELNSDFFMWSKLGGGLAASLIFSIVVLCVLVVRIVYEVRIYKLIDAGRSDEVLAVERNSELKAKRKKRLIIAGVILCVIAIAAVSVIVPTVNYFTSIFRTDEADCIVIGQTKSSVIQRFGEPYVNEDTYIEYYSDNYIKVFEQIQVEGEDTGNLGKLQAKLDGLTYKYIRIDFDEEGKVVKLFYDNKRKNSEDEKKIADTYELTTTLIRQYQETTLYYSVEYTDGSVYKGAAVEDFVSLYAIDCSIEWTDYYGNEYESVVSVGAGTKSGTVGLEGDVVVPYGVTTIDDLFRGEAVVCVTIPVTVKSIDDEAFADCTKLQRVIFESGSQLAKIGNSAFENCSALTQIAIPDEVKNVGEYAFYNCVSLESVTFSSDGKLTDIGDSAFEYCKALTEIVIPSRVREIGAYAFYGCDNLISVTFENASGWYTKYGSSNRENIDVADQSANAYNLIFTYSNSNWGRYYNLNELFDEEGNYIG